MAVSFVSSLLGFTGRGIANTADGDSSQSVEIAAAVLGILGINASKPGGQTAGTALEVGVRDLLASELPKLDPSRPWEVRRDNRKISEFKQYAHLGRVDALVKKDKTLRVEIGRDYMIEPDVTVGFLTGEPPPVLHAAVSCKFSIRSDRVQNIRHEGVAMIRHRRGRQPHIVTVTSEPLPSRLAAICRGTGEVDAVYHVCLDELLTAVGMVGNIAQRDMLDEIVGQGRLYDLGVLPAHLVV